MNFDFPHCDRQDCGGDPTTGPKVRPCVLEDGFLNVNLNFTQGLRKGKHHAHTSPSPMNSDIGVMHYLSPLVSSFTEREL